MFSALRINRRTFYTKKLSHFLLIIPKSSAVIVTKPRKHANNRRINFLRTLLVSLCVGIIFGLSLTLIIETDCDKYSNWNEYYRHHVLHNSGSTRFGEQNVSRYMRRPRFYRTELGLKNKLVVGIIPTDYGQLDKVIAINQTLNEHVDQLLVFVVGEENATKVKNLGVTGVVTFSSKNNTAHADLHQVALKAVKFLAEKFLDKYDYFFLGLDSFYVNGRQLVNFVENVSASTELLHGCSLESGLVFCQSMIRKLSVRLDRCFSSKSLMRDTSTKHKNETNDGVISCIKYAIGESPLCSKIATRLIKEYGKPGKIDYSADETLTIGPFASSKKIYEVHSAISWNRLGKIDDDIAWITGRLKLLIPKLPESSTSSWPSGMPAAHKPHDRHSVLKWHLFNSTSIFPTRNDTRIRMQMLEVSSVINSTSAYLHGLTAGRKSYNFNYGYRNLDEARGVQYILDFSNSIGEICRIEAARVFTKPEILPMPFVTESRRVTMVIPVLLKDLRRVEDFLSELSQTESLRTSNWVVVFAILKFQASFPPEELNNFQFLKKSIANRNLNFKNQSGVNNFITIKFGHVVVDLNHFPASNFFLSVLDMLGNRNRILSPNTLVLALDAFAIIENDFLNRVRMNTVLNRQIFAPIPFVLYENYTLTGKFKNNTIHKSAGFFDENSFNFIAFFMNDYLTARKRQNLSSYHLSKLQLKPVKPDAFEGVAAISRLLAKELQLHYFRAPEPTLIMKRPPQDSNVNNVNSKVDLAKLILKLHAE